jgi:hypothetical protein
MNGHVKPVRGYHSLSCSGRAITADWFFHSQCIYRWAACLLGPEVRHRRERLPLGAYRSQVRSLFTPGKLRSNLDALQVLDSTDPCCRKASMGRAMEDPDQVDFDGHIRTRTG